MFDWLGLSPAMTQILGIAMIVIGAAILLCLGLYLYGKNKELALNSGTEKQVKAAKDEIDVEEKIEEEPAVDATNSAEIKEDKGEKSVKTQQKKSSNKKSTKAKPAAEKLEEKKATASVKKQPAQKSNSSKKKATSAPVAVKKVGQTKKASTKTTTASKKTNSANLKTSSTKKKTSKK